MTRVTYTAKNEAAAQIVLDSMPRPSWGTTYWFDGRPVEVEGLSFSISGSKATNAAFRDLVSTANVKSSCPSGVPATDRQISYLTALIQDDPGAARTIGASMDGARCVEGLSKSQASTFIDLLKAGV